MNNFIAAAFVTGCAVLASCLGAWVGYNVGSTAARARAANIAKPENGAMTSDRVTVQELPSGVVVVTVRPLPRAK